MLRFSQTVARMVTGSLALAKQPLIAIIGSTGTGKSDLAVQLSRRFNGEIINADAIQMYEGLPIITNKIPLNERGGIPHHLLGSIGLDESTWTVKQFLPKTLEIIEEIRSRKRLPIVVGGTHYYTQALLFKDHTIEDDHNGNNRDVDGFEKFPILKESTGVILAKLREVDPVMANRWHPNDRRKIQRSLQIYLETGKCASETYLARLQAEVNETESLRFPTLILWPYCEREAHKSRLDNRVDKMLETGLLDEVAQLANLHNAKQDTGDNVDLTKGVWQAIGFRQFRPYQTGLKSDTAPADLEKIRVAAIEQTKAATRRYANSQLKWIRIKFLNALIRANALPKLFPLDTTDLSKWQTAVLDPAITLTQSFLSGEDLPDAETVFLGAEELLLPKKEDLTHSPESWGVQTCDVCAIQAATPQLWAQHLKSRRHKLRVSKKKAKETTALVSTAVKAESSNE